MTKNDLIKNVNIAISNQDLKDMIISNINLAYDVGFKEGMMRSAQIQNQVFDMLTRPKGVKTK